MAWTALSLAPKFNPATAPANRTALRNQMLSTGGPLLPSQGGSGSPDARSGRLNDKSLGGSGSFITDGRQPLASFRAGMSSSMPGFLQDPAGVLGDAMVPYADLISRILTPPAATGTSMPSALAQAYANAANAAAERTKQQTAAIQAANRLPSQIADAEMRASSILGNSLYGLPTGLGYRDPFTLAQNNLFNLRASALPGSTLGNLATTSAQGSGWLPVLPGY